MFRIRFHGRGGQGMKTASRILGTAFFKAGYQVQDAPRYGAERRGAPIFAYVRADQAMINERGIIAHPNLVVVADDTLIGMPAAGVTQGVDEHTLLLINSHENAEVWRQRLNTDARILILTAREDVEVVVITGDGAAYGMGMSATSGAMDRNLGFINFCYDNEGYGNTGQQYSAATPHAALTSTSKGSHGYPGYKKDLFAIWVAHNPAYVATVIAAEPVDEYLKLQGRFKHLFEPQLDSQGIAEIQARVDSYWEKAGPK